VDDFSGSVLGSSFTCRGYTVEAWSWEALKFWRLRDFIRCFINFIIARIEFLALNTCDSHWQGKHRTLPTIPFAGRLAAKQLVGVGDHVGVSILNNWLCPHVLDAWKIEPKGTQDFSRLSQPYDLTHFMVEVLLREVIARRLVWWFSRLIPIRRNPNPFIPQKEDAFPNMIKKNILLEKYKKIYWSKIYNKLIK
jgi:hypothetical protein